MGAVAAQICCPRHNFALMCCPTRAFPEGPRRSPGALRGGDVARVVWALLVAGALAGCASAIARNPVPATLEGQAEVVGMGQAPIRFWGDELPPNADALVKEKWAQVRANRPELLRQGKRPVINFLALSGGGSDGAFGAGLLGGWTASGNRPEFDLVTGVSTGALTAPFAFLGPRYDDGAQEGFHRVDHQGHRHRPADQGPARRRFAREQRAAGEDRRLLRERTPSSRRWRKSIARAAGF